MDTAQLTVLRAIRADVAKLLSRIEEHGPRLGRFEGEVAEPCRNRARGAKAHADLAARFDRMGERVDRIERRPDIAPRD